MPKIKNINKIMIIGSGPIVIGQACEFDYSGTQACKALKDLGYEIVLVNSNPATIMTDVKMADATYVEPLTAEVLTSIIKKEKVDAILPNLGGQIGLNLASELDESGILKECGVKIIGTEIKAIEKGEDRQIFKQIAEQLDIKTPKSEIANNKEQAKEVLERIGLPCVTRPAYTMGGTGGGVAFNKNEFHELAEKGLNASRIGQILIEESILGWEELELEIVRDSAGEKVTVCFIENIDAMGVHTGDSICVAPMLTVDKEIQKKLEYYSYKIADTIGIIGGVNIQFARNPANGDIAVIEINPRTSRSSALASKATGFPIAYITSLLACGVNLEELPYKDERTLDDYRPADGYVTVKFPKWNFEKFPADKDELGTQMKAVGEVMAIGKNYQEALQKAIRSREDERMGLGLIEKYQKRSLDELLSLAETPSSERFFIIYEALKKGATSTQIYERTNIKSWYSDQMKELIRIEEEVVSQKDKITDVLLKKAKKKGFSDEYIAQLIGQKKEYIKKVKEKKGIHKIYDRIKVSGIKDAEYYYSTYTSKKETINLKESRKKKVMILGGGPNRIGQGIEFDYCCVNGAFSLKEMGVKSIMVNCNPETVSTDYDISDKLYFEPLTSEDVISVYKKESPLGIICQFGGQTPLNISGELEKKGVNMLGTSVTAIKETEDRELFRKKMDKLNIPQPKSRTAYDLEEALKIARKIGYPIIVRPSFVLGGRSMKVINDENTFRKHIELTPDKNVWPLLIDRFLEEATEVEVDAVSDGEDVFIPTIMEHIEPAGVHSGNSFCVLPAKNILNKHKEKICEYAKKIIKEMNIVGLVNIQLVIYKNRVYVIEVNPRASRTVPLVSKVAGVSLVRMATRIMLGEKIKELKINDKNIDFYGVKRPIFPFYFFPKTDPALGPEMLATGESMGISDSFDMAFLKTWSHEKNKLPYKGKILVSIKYKNPQLIKALKKIEKKGFDIVFNEEDKYCLPENIKMVISVVDLKEGVRDKELRRMAISRKIPLFTQVSTATAAINAIVKNSDSEFAVQSLQEWQGLK